MDSPRLTSGKFHERPMLPRAIVRRPFSARKIPDVTTKTFEQHYLVDRARWSPRIAARGPGPDVFTGAYLGQRDSAASTAYLAFESDPDDDVIDERWSRVRRIFAMIPTDQVRFDSREFSRPAIHDLKLTVGSTTAWAVSFDELATSTLFFEQKDATIGAITLADTNETVTNNALPSSTITIGKTAGGTTSFSTGSDDATIQSALASAFGSSLTVTKGDGNIVATGASLSSTVLYASGSPITGLDVSYDDTGTIGTITIRAINQSRVHDPLTPTSVRTVTSASSGAAVGDLAVLWLADKIIAIAKVLTTPTGNTFTVAADEGLLAVGSIVISKCQFARNGLRLVNGTKDCTIRITEKFYGPTVTTGITTEADIPSVQLYTDPLGWLGRILATTLTSVTCATATDRFSKTAHGLNTGDTIFLLAKTNASSLVLLQQYWVIKVDADLFKVATSSDNALAGTAQAVGSDGTGITVLAPAPYAAIGVGRLEDYQGFIVSKPREEVQLSDALETRSAAA